MRREKRTKKSNVELVIGQLVSLNIDWLLCRLCDIEMNRIDNGFGLICCRGIFGLVRDTTARDTTHLTRGRSR